MTSGTPRRRRPGRSLAILSLLFLLSAAATTVRAELRLDFEQPYFVETLGNQCKDHALVKLDSLYHLFYIHSLPPVPPDYLRSERWLGHLTSADLVHWTRQDSILPVSEVQPQSWEGKFIWAPKVIKDPGSSDWFLFYTGVSETITQQTGLAYSSDLYDWNRWPLNPIYHPGSWAAWTVGLWSNCRDPEIFHEDGSPYWYLLNTATTSGNLGAISFARSQTLVNWTDETPLFVNDSVAVLESAQLFTWGGLYHLLFTEEGVQGTSHLTAPTLTGAWTKDNLEVIDVGNAPEISDLGDEVIFSRHNALASPEGLIFYYRFDRIDFDGPGGSAQIDPIGHGLDSTWSVVFGNAFDNQPTWGDNPHQRGDSHANLRGNSYLATYEDFPAPVDEEQGSFRGVEPIGLLKSEPFVIDSNRISLLVGGGDFIDREFVGLVSSQGDTLRFQESGRGSHSMTVRLWDTTSLIGEEVYIVVADLSFNNPEGYISVDEIHGYTESGIDPFPPTLPMNPGPLLEDVLSAAGYGSTAIEPQPAPALAGRLLAPYPNPFNPSTRLRYELERAGRVEITVLDATGRHQRTLLDAALPATPGFVTWDGRDDAGHALPSGVYFARLRLDGAPLDSRKLQLIR
ncbi:family 43 glycosylhydrolase [bacterium]|nr:family 43 glycosylhydrolase [bacterium]